jgi:hypothetical protein
MKCRLLVVLLFSCFLLTACGGADDKAQSVAKSDVVKAEPSLEPVQDEIALGTAVKDVIAEVKKEDSPDGVQLVEWDDLIPSDFKPDAILARYQSQINIVQEGSKAERELYDKVMGEFNSAGPNLTLDGKKVRIPGFIAPLENNGEMVGDFLLVPYFGSCIHSPPPPINQTVMVNPEIGKSVSLDQTSQPVWVVGELEAGDVATDLATAGYQIRNATVEPYEEDVN